MEYSLVVTEEVNESTRQEILAPLAEYNASQVGPSGNRPLAILVKNDSGAIVGGLWGNTAFEWLFIQLLVVPEIYRGRRLGTKIVHLAEEEAVRRGCHSAWLDTFQFQARGFYERLGYTCFGELANYPTGHARYFMNKRLSVVPPAA